MFWGCAEHLRLPGVYASGVGGLGSIMLEVSESIWRKIVVGAQGWGVKTKPLDITLTETPSGGHAKRSYTILMVRRTERHLHATKGGGHKKKRFH